jgi:hypothetical protein
MPLPAELVRVGVVLLMDPYLIRGTIYLPPEVARFSDAWESVLADRRIFIPVTDAEILRGEETVLKTPFIHVRKADVRAASPLDEPPRPNRSDA